MKQRGGKKPVIGIIGGNGRFGGWFRGFFESKGLTVLVSGRKTALTPEKLARAADIVIISVPIPQTEGVIRAVRDHVRANALLADFTSLKTVSVKEMLKAKPQCGVLGIHPLFGPLLPSIKNQIITFCPGRNNHWVMFLKKLFEENGATVVFATPKNHDEQMAMIQAFTHFLNIIFARTIQRQKTKPLAMFSSPVFRLQSVVAGRVLGGKPELYADLEMANPYFLKVLDDFIAQAQRFTGVIRTKNKRGFVRDFKTSAAFMRHFIPVAQAKAVELVAMMDRQPVAVAHGKRTSTASATREAVAYLGPEGTFSHQATLAVFPRARAHVPSPTITGVFDALMNDKAVFGVVPAENSTEGVIQETLDNLVKYPLEVIGSYNLPIHLCLLARTPDASTITTIKSHPQPLAQARNWLANHFPNALFETASSSVKAILSTSDPRVAFIASRHAAAQHKLTILAENIEDKKTNVTQFYVIAHKSNPAVARNLKAQKTLLALAVYDRPGVLRDVLAALADEGLNLSKLYSRPGISMEAENWDYYFFLEVEALPKEKGLQRALVSIKKHCSIVRVLGVT